MFLSDRAFVGIVLCLYGAAIFFIALSQ